MSSSVLGGLGCQANGQTAAVAQVASLPSPNLPQPPSGFDAGRAEADFVRLAKIDARYEGARRSSKARKHLKRALTKTGFEVIEVETPLAANASGASSDANLELATAIHLFARVEGDDRDAILLVAPYDSRPALGDRAADGTAVASGAAVLLELARLDREAGLTGAASPMAWWLAMVDGDGSPVGESADTVEGGDAGGGAAGTDGTLQTGFPGSEAFVAWLAGQPEAQRIRLVVFVDRVGDARIDVARDLHSNRTYREVFFAVGAERGHVAFAPDRPLSAPAAGHRAFVARGIAPVVAIIGEPLAPTTSLLDPELRDGVDANSSDSLFAVGDTIAVALERIGDRLARIDAFRIDPLRGGPGEVALPGGDQSVDEEGSGSRPAVDSGEPGPGGGAD